MKNYMVQAAALAVLGVCCCVSVDAHADPVSPRPNQTEPQEPHWQLFLDDHVIERSTGFQRVLHHPRPHGIVLEGDKPWEQTGVAPLYVGWRKDGSLECYYRAHGPTGPANAYAVSEDGLHWEKPNLHLVDTPWGKENNLVPCSQPWNLGLYGNVRDPSKRFAISLATPKAGKWGKWQLYFASEPPDIINDPDWREKLMDSGGHKPGPYNNLEFWDDIHQEWVGMRQGPNHPPVRCAGRYASPDLTNWTLDHYLYPDAHDSTDPRYFDEVYGMISIHVEGVVLGFPYWFIGDRTHSNPELYGGADRLHTTEGLIGKAISKGTMEVRLVLSRDGCKTWDRTVSREAWIPHGTEQHSYDRLVRIDGPPLRMGAEDWFYCSGYDGDHSSGRNYYHDRGTTQIRGTLYTQKHNRYVSLTAGNTNQILITKPLKVTGKTLQLNVDGSRGEVKVAIGIDKWLEHKTGSWPFKAKLPHWTVEDRWERTHLEKGFHFEDCKPVHVDSIEHNVEWKDASLESLLGETVRLYVLVQDADLYGFRFK